MFCPNCGKRVEIPNQKFCLNCGSELPFVPEILQSPHSPQITQKDVSVQVSERKPVQIRGPHSKRTLGFGVASLVIAYTLYNIGAGYIIEPISNYYFPRLIPIVFIVLSIFHSLGLIFGIASKINNQQAREMESMNTFIKVGNVLGIIGIIINTIFLVICFVIIGLSW